MNKRWGSSDVERRSRSWRLVVATLLASAAWGLFLSNSQWLFSGSEPLKRKDEPIDMRLVEWPVTPHNIGRDSAIAKPPDAATHAFPRPAEQPTHPVARRHEVARIPLRKAENPPPAPPPTTETARRTAPPVTPSVSSTPTETAAPQSNASAASPLDAQQSTEGHSDAHESGPARLVAQPLPELPDDLREDGYQFVAVARFVIHANGTFDVELIKPTPNPRLNQILIATLHRWRFVPATEAGHPVESRQDVRVHFNVD